MSGQMMSPTSTGGFVRRAAPEPNKRALYIGGLDARVTEDILKQIFETTGHVQSVKIIPDKNVSVHCWLFLYIPAMFHIATPSVKFPLIVLSLSFNLQAHPQTNTVSNSSKAKA